MKKALKLIGAALLIVVCLAMTAFAGFFLWSAIPREKEEPQVLSMDQLFTEEEAALEAAPPAVETPPTEETLEAPVEEAPEEAPPAEEEAAMEAEPPQEEPAGRAALAHAY